MAQFCLSITGPKAEAEELYTILMDVFDDDGWPVAITEIDEDKQIFEASLYLEEGDEADAAERILAATKLPKERLVIQKLPDIDWVQHSLAGLKPVRAGRFFVHGSHDRDKIKAGDLAIEIEAGQAFGTGHHGTTAGCLEMIEAVMAAERPTNILDLGTGSGVLAIGAAKLAPVKILATDIDPVATGVAHNNIILNGVDAHVVAITATGFDHELLAERAPFDLIIANILAGPLIELAPDMAKAKAPDGSIILSGILDTQRERVLAAYEAQGLHHQRTILMNGWVTLHIK